KPGVGKVASSKAPVRVAHIEGNEGDVVASFEVHEGPFEFVDGAAIDEFEEATSSDIDDHRDEAPRGERFSASERVFIETDDRGPIATPFPVLEVEVPVECRVQPACGAPEIATDVGEIAVALAGAEHGAAVAFGVTEALADAGERFSERL